MILKIAALLLCLLLSSSGQEQTFTEIANPNGTIPKPGSREAAYWGMLRLKVRLADRTLAVRGRSEQQLMTDASNPNEEEHTRMACAILLLREHESPEAHLAALSAFNLQGSVLDGEEETADWKAHYPVAAVAMERPELLATIVRKGISGEFRYFAVDHILTTLHERGQNNAWVVEPLLREAILEEDRRRGESLLATAQGEWIPYDPPPPPGSAPEEPPPSPQTTAPVPKPTRPANPWLWIAAGAAWVLALAALGKLFRARKAPASAEDVSTK